VPAAVSPSLRKLLDATIDSIEKLDLVIALYAAPGRRLPIDTLTARLGFVGRDEIRRLAQDLSAHGLTVETLDDHIVLIPQSSADESALAELAAIHANDKALLIVAIAERAIERLRELAGRAFTQAFATRRRDPGDDDLS
jgi:hypothetical protein